MRSKWMSTSQEEREPKTTEKKDIVIPHEAKKAICCRPTNGVRPNANIASK